VISIDITADLDVLDAIEEQMQRAPSLMATAYKRAVDRFIARPLLAELRREPGAARRPIEWQSERQRRAYFATDGFGRGIPSRRTGKLLRAFRVSINGTPRDGVLLVLTNDTPYVRYVMGDDMQKMHIRTGWQPYAPIVARYREQSTTILIDTWSIVAVPEQFRR
jgi:hypothetical protein